MCIKYNNILDKFQVLSNNILKLQPLFSYNRYSYFKYLNSVQIKVLCRYLIRRFLNYEYFLGNHLSKYQKLCAGYKKFINEYLQIRHMEIAPKVQNEGTQFHFRAHHAVCRQQHYDKNTCRIRYVM